MYYTYVILCKRLTGEGPKFYVGSTSDLKNRIQEHKAHEVEYTKSFDILELVYYEACIDKTDARKRELQLKTGFGRGYINRRIENFLTSRH